MGAIYERAIGGDLYKSFQRELADPLSMQDFDPLDGNRVYDRTASVFPIFTFKMTARDLARFGLLMLRGGRRRERNIVPGDWVPESTRSWSKVAPGAGYGYLWWSATTDRYGNADVGPGSFWTRGTGGHLLLVSPSMIS